MSTYRFSFPTLIHFGAGVRADLPKYLTTQGFKRPLIVTDRAIAALPIMKKLTESLSEAGLQCEAFSEIWGNPVKSQVTEGVNSFHAHRADSIIGFGGGAALDVAKAIGLMATHPGDLFDYEDDKPGARAFDKEIPFWVAVPTTSGTGSEVGRSSVVSDDQTHIKKIIFSPKLLARAVFSDPELTLELPAKMTAATGMDALTHCVESYLAKGFHPICDGIALEGTRLAAQSLAKAVSKPHDIGARSDMMMSSMMGAIAFQKGLGVTHSCAHALGTVTDMHHGLANGIMIDHALKMNLSAVPDRFKTLATMIGLKDPTPQAFIGWLEQLKKDCGIPSRLSEAGVKKDQLERLVQVAVEDSCHQNNPRVCSREDFVKIFNEAM